MEALFNQLFIHKGRKVLAVGKNYLAHAIEMGGSAVPTSPVIFTKPLTSIVHHSQPIHLPNTEVHHEGNLHTVELAVMINQLGKNIPEHDAMNYVAGYCIALDLTARDIQANCKASGLPWDIAKGQDYFLPLSDFITKEEVNNPHDLDLEFKINGETKQRGNTGDMHFKIPFLISYLSQHFTLCPGDIILTGTPEGVGPIRSGDQLDASIHEKGRLVKSATFRVA